jgi:hypothetical protein
MALGVESADVVRLIMFRGRRVVGALLPLWWLPAVALIACSSGAPNESPRSVAETVTSALDEGDVQRFLEVLPPEDKLGEAFDCGRSDSLRAALRRRLDELRAEFEARRKANFKVRLVAFDLAGSTTAELAPGDVFQGCTARHPLTLHSARVSLSRQRAGRIDDTTETWSFLRFEPNGPWYYGKL